MNESPTSSSTDEGADLARRRVLKAGGSLSIAFFLMGVAGPARAIMNARRQSEDAAAAASDGSPAFAPNAFIRIDTDGTVRMVMPNVEMGQGIYTGASMLLAEELGVGLDQIKVEHAPASDELYGNPIFYLQVTGGSTSTRGGWKILREAGAVARTMLVAAAAARWKVHPATCRAARGKITHSPSDRSLGFGELARRGGQVPAAGRGQTQRPQRVRPHREADAPGRHGRQSQWHDTVWSRCAPPWPEGRHGHDMPELRRTPHLGGRHACTCDSWGDRCHPLGQRGRCDRRAFLGRQKRHGGVADRVGSRSERPPHYRRSSPVASQEFARGRGHCRPPGRQPEARA